MTQIRKWQFKICLVVKSNRTLDDRLLVNSKTIKINSVSWVLKSHKLMRILPSTHCLRNVVSSSVHTVVDLFTTPRASPRGGERGWMQRISKAVPLTNSNTRVLCFYKQAFTYLFPFSEVRRRVLII